MNGILELYENRVDDSVPSRVPQIRVSIMIHYSFQMMRYQRTKMRYFDWLIILASDNNIEDKGGENINGTEVEIENEDFVSGSKIYIYWS